MPQVKQRFLSLRGAVAAILLCLFFSGCTGRPIVVTGQRFLMHTCIEITIVHENALEAQREMEAAFQIFRGYDRDYNFFDPGSLLGTINRSREEEIAIPPDLCRMLDDCLRISKKSGGAFNINVGPLMRLWNFSARNPEIPDEKKIRELLPGVNAPVFSVRKGTLYKKPGACLDLSGVVKGYAVDSACDRLIRRGISRALVNAGGNIRAIGRNREGRPWKIGIIDPRSTGEILGELELENMSVATSGDYFNYFIKEGVRYHHILDPHTGYPAPACMSATVVSERAGLADILAKPAFILGPEKGKRFLSEMGCEGVFVTNSRITVTPGLTGKITLVARRRSP